MIIDTHVHYTQPPSAERPYTHPAASVFPIEIDALLSKAADAGVDGVVQVTPSCMGYDNRYAFEGAVLRPEKVFGVVGRFDPFAADLGARLEQFMKQPKAIGVRQTLHHEWTKTWLQEGKLDDFLAEAQNQDVPVFLYAPDQTHALLATAHRFPRLRIVVDHTALQHSAASLDAVFAQWDSVIALGLLPNVWLKVSYFPESAAQFEAYPFAGAQEKFRRLHQAVGAARMVWGSNFTPVEHLSNWGDALRLLRDECAFLDESDRIDILGANFRRAFAPRWT